MLFSRLLLYFFISFCTFAQFETNPNNKIALVIIDMQTKFFTRNARWQDQLNQKKYAELITHQVKVIKRAKELSVPILKIKFEGFDEFPESLNKHLLGYPHLKTYIKDSNNFLYENNASTKSILKFLNSNKIANLIFQGINGGSCVLASIRGAMANTFNVIADVNGIADLNKAAYFYPYQGMYSFHRQLHPANFRESDSLDQTLDALNDSALFYNQ